MKIEKQGCYLGYEYLITINPELGIRCGYVKVEPGDYNIKCHGGLTFKGQLPGFKGYWIGFDCGHYDDIINPELFGEHIPEVIIDRYKKRSRGTLYWGLDEVQAECKSICAQLEKQTR